jgi:N-methylhydantoinase A/oxoprolinase/acetone carboxylase beta subunit
MTDANLLLGQLIPEYFPKIFGKSEKEPLDTDPSRREFKKLARDQERDINNHCERILGRISLSVSYRMIKLGYLLRPALGP